MQSYLEIKKIKKQAMTVGVVGVILISVMAWFFVQATSMFFLESKGNSLKRISSSLSKQINADEHATINTLGDMVSPAYDKISKVLEDYQADNPEVVSAYTMRIDGNAARFIVSPPADINRDGKIEGDLEKREGVGAPYSNKPDMAMLGALQGKSTADKSFTEDRWGTWLTACAPLKKSAGNTDGIVCVDEDQKEVKQSLFKIHTMTAGLSLVSALLMCGMLIAYVKMKAELGTRKLMQEERESSLTHFVSAIEHLGVIAVQSFDSDIIIKTWNGVSEKIFDMPRTEALGSDLSVLLTNKEDAADFRKDIENVLKTGEPTKPRERKIVNRKGESHTLLSTMFPIIEGGEVVEVFCLDVDVTK